MLELARLNAAQPRHRKADRAAQALMGLARRLGMEEPPGRMECVDISHLGGKLTVASLVAMQDGELDKAGYRHYKILTLGPEPDDFAAMAEVVGRRLGGDSAPPDLLVLDGGKGQLNAALARRRSFRPGGGRP